MPGNKRRNDKRHRAQQKAEQAQQEESKVISEVEKSQASALSELNRVEMSIEKANQARESAQ